MLSQVYTKAICIGFVSAFKPDKCLPEGSLEQWEKKVLEDGGSIEDGGDAKMDAELCVLDRYRDDVRYCEELYGLSAALIRKLSK